jgi:hypothetical protein
MGTRYVLRVQADPADEPAAVAERMVRLAERTGADELCVFLFGMEFNDGNEPLDRIDHWLDRTRPWRAAVRSAGISVSLNPGHTLGHCDWGRPRRDDWQPMVDQRGTAADVVVCPLDPGWRGYFADTLRRYAAEDLDAVWIEDDIRLHNHEPLEWGGCFCPLHLAEFARVSGVEATRDEVVAACTAPGPPHPWRELWLDMWERTQLELVGAWQKIAADRGVRLGLMSSSPEAHAAEGRRWSDWLPGFDLHRPHFWGYSDTGAEALPRYAALLDAQRAQQPPGLVSYPEIECWPYGQWNKSYRQTFAQMATAHILGCDGLAISLYDFLTNHPDDEPGRADFLAGVRPALDWLADTFDTSLRTVGVGVPWSQETGRAARTGDGTNHDGAKGDWRTLAVPHREWAGWLGAIGHAVTLRGDAPVNAVAGESAWAYDDATVRDWLTGGLLLDGAAARILAERGYGELIGLNGVRRLGPADPLPVREVCEDPDFSLRVGAMISVDPHINGHPPVVVGDPAPGARVASRIVDGGGHPVGPGLVLHRNALGGRVAVCPWPATTAVRMTPQRAAQLSAAVDWLGAGTHARVSGGPWLVPQVLTDGARWRLVVWNAGPDEVDTVTVRLPAGMPAPAGGVQITARGEQLPIGYADGVLDLHRPLGQWEFAVLTAERP